MSTYFSLSDDLLARAVDDWVTAGEVIDLVKRSGATNPVDLRDLATGLISRLIAADLLIAGDVDEHGHQPWACSKEAAIARIIIE